MSHYLKKFDTHAEYDDYINSSSFVMGDDPNVSLCVLQNDVHYAKALPLPKLSFKFKNIVTPATTQVSSTPYQVYMIPESRGGSPSSPAIYPTSNSLRWVMKDASDGTIINNELINTNKNSYGCYFSAENAFDIDLIKPSHAGTNSFSNAYYNNRSTSPFATHLRTNVVNWSMTEGRSLHTLCYECEGDIAEFFGTNTMNKSKMAAFFQKNGNWSIYYSKIPSLENLVFTDLGAYFLCGGQIYLDMPIVLTQPTLYQGCFLGAFSGCSLINDVTVHFTEWLPTTSESLPGLDATYNWLNGVSATGVFRCPRALSIERGVSRIPEGWDIEYID